MNNNESKLNGIEVKEIERIEMLDDSQIVVVYNNSGGMGFESVKSTPSTIKQIISMVRLANPKIEIC